MASMITTDCYASRRKKLLKQIGNNNIAVVFSSKEYVRGVYRQDSNFYYLTGFTEPESIAVFAPGRSEGEFILFNLENDTTKELWYGERVGQKKACSEFGADQSFPIKEFDLILNKLLIGRKRVEIDSFLYEMRLKKSSYELDIIRKAAKITTEGHLRAMRKCHPDIYEFELEAELLYEFMRLGGRYEAFKTIVAGGVNACTLHYEKNNKKLIDGDLVLIDAGAEYEYYCADISRTFPVNGKFTQKQRTIYEAVLEAQLETIAHIKPGIRFDNLQLIAEDVIAKHLSYLGFLKEATTVKQFFMHKIGHWLGLDTHDVANYKINHEWRILEPGMVLTIEPGIYIISDNIGVRIEDDVLVTENGCEVLTEGLPKTVQEIEAEMKK